MKTINQHIREHLLGPANYLIKRIPDVQHMRGILFLDFIIYMARRMILGRFRYGNFLDQSQPDYDRVSSMQIRLSSYNKHGNKEHLLDIANLCMIEFYKSKHPKAHFKPIDDGSHTKIKRTNQHETN